MSMNHSPREVMSVQADRRRPSPAPRQKTGVREREREHGRLQVVSTDELFFERGGGLRTCVWPWRCPDAVEEEEEADRTQHRQHQAVHAWGAERQGCKAEEQNE